MAKKEKEQKPVLDLDGVKYEIDDMTDSQKELAGEVSLYQNHVRDIQNKLSTNNFIGQQLVESEKVFVDKFQKGLKELKSSLNSEEEAEAEA
jgi:flagellin-specific chaperone FliS|tara:strand:- start:173 stop:448 length:276 start_codon:yes stop_codon:yes gene_type:complete